MTSSDFSSMLVTIYIQSYDLYHDDPHVLKVKRLQVGCFGRRLKVLYRTEIPKDFPAGGLLDVFMLPLDDDAAGTLHISLEGPKNIIGRRARLAKGKFSLIHSQEASV